jgi:hypothetical protein
VREAFSLAFYALPFSIKRIEEKQVAEEPNCV